MRYRRARVGGGTYFFTVVTYQRQPILVQNENVSLLREAFRYGRKNYSFTIDAIVLLPEHLHCIWTFPEEDRDFSARWQLIKGYFSRKCDDSCKQIPNASRERKKEQALWQRRFWEHLIQDDADFQKHVEYIHFNPVKHGHVAAPGE